MLIALQSEGAAFLVVGAHALAVHGVVRTTGDLDILVRDPDLARLIAFLGGRGFGFEPPALPRWGFISDASFALNFLFLGGPDLPAPFPDCAVSSADRDMAQGCLDDKGCAP